MGKIKAMNITKNQLLIMAITRAMKSNKNQQLIMAKIKAMNITKNQLLIMAITKAMKKEIQ
jgi:uncharacterized membrane protein YobD (UPF0266 family)